MSKFDRVVVTGSIAFDHIMSMPGVFGDHIMPDKIHQLNVSFIMQTFRKEFGGTGGNIAYSLGLMGVNTVLVGTAGNDFANYKKHLKKIKAINIDGIRELEDVATAQGFVMTDREDNQIWGFFEGAMGREDELSLLEVLHKDDFLIVGPNNPKAMIKFVDQAIEKKIAYMFDPAFNIAHFAKKDLKRAVVGAEILIGNDYEIELICRRLGWDKGKLLNKSKLVVTTLGSRGSVVEIEGEKLAIGVAKVKNVSDPTGAGDAYRAGFVSGYVSDTDLTVCAQRGAVSAAYTVEKYGTQTHQYGQREFEKRFKANFD